jgi:hypothetical protein
MRFRLFGFSVGLLFLSINAHAATVGACKFDVSKLSFLGSATEQAQCLLRKVRKAGNVDAAAAALPPSLSSKIGTPVGNLKAKFRNILVASSVFEASIGGNLDNDLSHAKGGDTSAPKARYFVIHDTSSPYLGNATKFPANIDTSDKINKISDYAGSGALAHIFLNRRGKTLTGHDFSVPWRATKLETKVVGIPAKGLFLHIELIQPRRREPSGPPNNDQIAPMPGFTAQQYEKLAILYVAASIRSGTWLIPAFHAALDQGLNDAHDDPQNFELAEFAAALDKLMSRMAN